MTCDMPRAGVWCFCCSSREIDVVVNIQCSYGHCANALQLTTCLRLCSDHMGVAPPMADAHVAHTFDRGRRQHDVNCYMPLAGCSPLAAQCSLLNATCYVPAIGGTPSLPASGGICRKTSCQGVAKVPSVRRRLATGTIPAAGRRLRAAMHFSVYSQRDHIGMQANMQLATHTHTQKHRHKHRRKQMHRPQHSSTHIQTHRHTQTHTDTHRHTQRRTHTHTATDTHTSMSKHPIIRFFAHHRPFCLKLRSSTAIA